MTTQHITVTKSKELYKKGIRKPSKYFFNPRNGEVVGHPMDSPSKPTPPYYAAYTVK